MLGLSDDSYVFCASVIALRKGMLSVPVLLVSLHQRSLLDSGTASGGAVTCCYRSLSCDGHSLALCGFLYLLVALNIGLVRVHICQAKRCVLRTDGHEPFSFLDPGALFALAVPDVYFAKGVSVMLCLLRGVSDGNPARLPSARFFAWVRSRSVADTNSLCRMFSLLRGDGGFLRSI